MVSLVVVKQRDLFVRTTKEVGLAANNATQRHCEVKTKEPSLH